MVALSASIFRAYEKLDGTNFDIRGDGAMFDRRLRGTGDEYCKVH
jgi:hypothetical protein